MISRLKSHLPFISGVLTFLLFVAAGALSANLIGVACVCLVSFCVGASGFARFTEFAGGILAALVACCMLGFALGDQLSSTMIMLPIIATLVFFYCGVAFLFGWVSAKLFHSIVRSKRTR